MKADGIEHIFFDLDHTLWDFEKNSALTFKKILADHKINVDANQFINTYIPLNEAYWKLYQDGKIDKEELRYKRLKTAFDALDAWVEDSIIHTLSEDYISHLPNYTHLFEHTVDVLEYLKPKYGLHIITNGFQEVQFGKLKNANIHHYFEHIINSESVGVKKPDPKIFNFALQLVNVSPEKTVMIGDNLEADILGAQNVGMHTIHFNSTNGAFTEGRVTINSLLEIKRYL